LLRMHLQFKTTWELILDTAERKKPFSV
jgi:hypothetical protein